MRKSRRTLIISVLMTLALGVLGFFAAPVGINALGFVLFWWHPEYMRDQGLDTLLFFLGLLLSPLGAIYGVGSGILMSVAARRWSHKRRRIGIVLAIGYLALLTAIVLLIGFFALHHVAGILAGLVVCLLYLALGRLAGNWLRSAG
jgi:MFS family permease